MNWRKIINDNIPAKYKYNSKYVALYNNIEEWNGFDFDIKSLPLFYDNQRYLAVYILKTGKNAQILDRIEIDLTNL